MVTGNITHVGEKSRHFSQTFLLVMDESGLYYAMNDIFRYSEPVTFPLSIDAQGRKTGKIINKIKK